MFAGSLFSKDRNTAADTPTPATTTTSSAGKAGGGNQEGVTREGGEWSPPRSVAAAANGKAKAGGAAPGRNGDDSSEDDGPAKDEGMWGYRSSLSSKGCWKVDAWASARKDTSVELDFDSVAFDLFVPPEHEKRGGGAVAATAPAGARTAGNRAAARHDRVKSSENGSGSRTSNNSNAPAVVFNVVPFRLGDGLPRELGPLLFSADDVSSLLSAGSPDHHRPPSRGARRGHAKQKTVAAEPEGGGSRPVQTQEHEEEEEREEEEKKEVLWVKRKDPSGSGHVILSHIHCGPAAAGAAGTAVEVRIRGEPLDVGALAKVGLPQDMSELAVTTTVDAVAAAVHSKRTGEVVAGVGSGVGNKQERRKQRAAAH